MYNNNNVLHYRAFSGTSHLEGGNLLNHHKMHNIQQAGTMIH